MEPEYQDFGLAKPAKNRDFIVLAGVAVVIIGAFILLTFKLIDQEDSYVADVENVKMAEGFTHKEIGIDEAEQTLDSLIKKKGKRKQADFSTLNLNDEMMKKVATIKELRNLDVAHTKVTDKGLECIVNLHLTEIDVSGCAITDEAMKSLAKITDLEKVTLTETPITDAGLAELKKLPVLDNLALAGSKITDRGIAELADYPSLQRLDLTSTNVTDHCLKDISKMHHLRSFIADSTMITGAGMSKYLRSSSLHKVGVAGCRILDADLSGFPAAMPKVNSIDLSSSNLTDMGVAELVGWKEVTVLKLRHVDHVTEAGKQNFRNQRPDCELQVDKLL